LGAGSHPAEKTQTATTNAAANMLRFIRIASSLKLDRERSTPGLSSGCIACDGYRLDVAQR
jgi:hypothetical protein